MRGISRRYSLVIGILVGSLLVAAGAVQIWLAYQDNIERTSQTQRAEAKAAGARIQDYLRDLEIQVRSTGEIASIQGALTDNDRREELHRLLKVAPSVLEVRALDSSGHELLYVSRIEPDRVRSNDDLSANGAYARSKGAAVTYGTTYLRGVSEPYVSVAVHAVDGAASPTLLVELNLKFVTDIINEMRIGQAGKAYVVDRDNRLLAHPNLSLVLSGTDMSQFRQVRAARAALGGANGGDLPTLQVRSLEGDDVLTSAIFVPAADWIVFVEQPTAETLAPVRASVLHSLLLLLAGLAIAFVASRMLAGALTKPILQLKRAAERIAVGDLATRIDVRTGDEIEALANGFNQMADKLEESYAGLEAKIQARTHELSVTRDQVQHQARELQVLNAQLNERLVQLGEKKEEADRANAAKTRFLASASHDLRQPMHTISLLVGILHERLRDGDIGQLLAKVELSVEAMENLFKSLLDISKLDAGAISPNVIDFEVGELLRRVGANYAPQAQQKGIALRVRESRVIVRSDPALLERVIGNMVSNAIRYTRQGKVLVGCRHSGSSLRIEVRDTGVGIAGEHLEDIFEEFVQLDNPERDRSKGLGLGLSIVKRTAELLGHRLSVHSEPGRGSVFEIEIPLVGRADKFIAATETDLEAGGRLAGVFVVVIDDDQENRFAMEVLCRQWGCHVASGGSLDEALRSLENHLRSPDLIISDYRLRERQNGFAAIEAIRRVAEQVIPAIVVTGDMAVGELAGTAQAGIVVLHKPINADALRRAAESLLASQPAPAPASSGGPQ